MAELFVEIGTEELPARFVLPTAEGLATNLMNLLHAAPTAVFATPRRLAVVFADLPATTPVVESLVTGPPVSVAFRDGVATPAAVAFAAKFGISVDALSRQTTPKGEVIAATKVEGGQPLAELVAAGLAQAILSIPHKKSMRWGDRKEQFPRPIRYVCAVIDGTRVAASVCGRDTVDTSEGHWLWSPTPFPVASAEQWRSTLRDLDVIADYGERRALLVEGLKSAAEGLGLQLQLDEELVNEVTNLVEKPTIVAGEFLQELLALPERLLVESMRVNQRYFPLYANGVLTNKFLLASNNPRGNAALIARGNARVLAARFHDAKFFYAEDRKKSLATHGEKLAEMLWIRGVKDEAGRQFTMHMRAGDVAASAGELARTFEASGSLSADPDWLLTQGWLCKADLTTQMVGEFDTLQGHVGRLLANEDAKDEGLSGDALVARLAKNLAIEEHYLPRFAGDALPRSPEGVCLALAERITLLCRTFAAGMAPKGGDPLALRRAANGVLAIVRERRLAVSPGMLIEAAQMGTVITGEARVSLEEFILARLRATLGEEGVPTDVIEAVFATGETDVLALADRAGAFSALVAAGGFGAIRATFRRVAGLVKQNPGERAELSGLDPAALGPAGVALAAAVDAVNTRASVADQLNVLVALRPLVDAFFDSVMVMAEELPLRTARLGLLRTIVARFSNLADFSKLSTE